jgi:cyclophilin family peptidyl-prolyl cis-trans isomerase
MNAAPRNFLIALLFTLFLGGAENELLAAAPTAPSNLKVLPQGSNTFQLDWQDNSSDETGWEIRVSLGNDAPVRFDRVTQANVVGKILTFAGYFPGVTLNFQVAAYNGVSGSEVFGLSPIVKAKGVSPAKFWSPGSLRAASFTDGEVSLTWQDNSTVEYGYEVEFRTGTETNFTILGSTNPLIKGAISIGSLTPSTLYTYRLRAYTTSQSGGNSYLYSPYTNTVTFTTKPFQAPTDLVARSTSDSSIQLSWKDQSSIENGYDIEYRKVGQTEIGSGSAEANTQVVNITDLELGVPYEFRVRASRGEVKSAFTPYVQMRIDDRFTSSSNPPIFFQTPFSYVVTNTRPESVTDITVTGLPAGLSYDATTKTISGSATVEGVRTAKVKAFYGTSYSIERDLVFRIIRVPIAPRIVTNYTPQTLTVRRSVRLSVTGRFSDPDTVNPQRVATSVGNFDIIPYPFATPVTVKNFLTYVSGRRYVNSFFHRSLPSFVVQGGGFAQTGTSFLSVVKSPSIMNEPGISNVRGTVAMAKLPDLPNSATSEFFVSVSDNSANLDAQNAGFTVFGRVPPAGMAVMDAINGLPTRTYPLTIAGTTNSFENIPINSATPAPTITPSQLVRITSIAAAPIMTYQVSSQNPAVATAVLVGTNFTILGIAKGATTVTVTATDLDGMTTSQVVPVTVN